MNLIVVAAFLHVHFISCLIYINKGIGIHCHLLSLGWGRDVYLVGLLQICPLSLSVEPYDSLWRTGIEFVSFDGNSAAARTYFRI